SGPGALQTGGRCPPALAGVAPAPPLRGRGGRPVELWNLHNPINPTRAPADVAHYKVEPSVICADVYGAPPHTGRGGWTWYTGAAGWPYPAAPGTLLGLRLGGGTPCF